MNRFFKAVHKVKSENTEFAEELPSSILQRQFIEGANLYPEYGGQDTVIAGLEINGEISERNIEQTFQLVINRHDALRTTCREGILKIEDTYPFSLECLEATEEQVKEVIQSQMNINDTATPPLYNVLLLHLPEKRHILVLQLHRLIGDKTSCNIIFNDFVNLYNGIEPKELKATYWDFIRWHNSIVAQEGFQKQRRYWENKLSGEFPSINLPLDKRGGNKKTPVVFKAYTFTVPKDYTYFLSEIAGARKTSLDTVLFSLFTILLYKYAGQKELTVGYAADLRSHEDLHKVVGNFENIIGIESSPEGNNSFKKFLGTMQSLIIQGLENRDYPLGLLGKQPFDALFRSNMGQLWEDKRFNKYCIEPEFTSPLTMEVELKNRLIECTIIYDQDLFEEQRIRRMGFHMNNLIKDVVRDPAVRLDDSYILSIEEEIELEYFNSTSSLYPKYQTIHSLFQDQVRKSANKTAAVFENSITGERRELTYRELNDKANSLASILREEGIRPGHRVGILVDKSIEMVIAVMAVIKSGGAITPIDPEYPLERIEYLLENSQTAVLLTKTMLLEEKGLFFGGEIIDLEDQRLYSRDIGDLEEVNNPEDLLYLIYTSGTTGRPKGVMIKHQNIVNLVYYQVNHTNLEFRNKKVSQFAAFSFDVCYQEIFSTLLGGGELHIIGNDKRKDVEKLFAYLEKVKLDVLFLPTAFFKFISNYENYLKLIPSSIDHIVVAGEQLLVSSLLKKYLKEKEIYLHNHYGPSETHVVTALTMEFWKDIPEIPSIGQPISNTGIYILNQSNRMQPIGVPGELCIGGDNVGLGYLNKPELTAEKFVDDPFRPGQKMYKTGDIARWLPDGTIDYLGRRDHQVKIRGFRVELGSIETILKEHEGIKNVVVLPKYFSKTDVRLIAFVVLDDKGLLEDGKKLFAKEIREYLSSQMPDYMIPAFFHILTSIPLTPNGKVDRNTLLDIDIPIVADVEYEAPRNEIEMCLVGLWQEALAIHDDIGINYNFFDLGGDSLKSAVISTKIKQIYGVDVSFLTFFKTPYIKDIAELIESGDSCGTAPLEAAEKREYYPLSSAQKRMYIVDRFEKDNISYNETFVKIIEGKIDVPHLEYVFKTLIQRHESFRTGFTIVGEEVVQKIYDEVDFSIEYSTWNHQFWDDKDLNAIVRQFRRHFNFEKPPLIRVGVVKLADEYHLLIMDMHHIITDGTSEALLMEEISRLYRGESLEDIAIQYKDYAVWQNSRLTTDEMKKQADYWLQRFKDDVPALNLPTDYPRPAVQSFEGARFSFKIDQYLSQGLNNLAKDTNSTLYMVLLAAFKTLLFRYTGVENIEVGSGIANRQHADLQHIIGMFVNMIVIRSNPVGGKTFKEFVEEIRESCLMAYENQDYQFDVLVNDLKRQRDPSHNPMFDVAFVLQNMDIPEIEIPGVSVREFEFEDNNTSKFDITLEAIEKTEEIIFNIEYCRKLFKEESIARFAQCFVTIVSEIVHAPATPLGEINILSDDDKVKLFGEFNNTGLSYDTGATIHGLFEKQVDLTPDNTALVHKGQSLTYRELDERANQIAAFLINKQGVKPDDLVGILLSESLELFTAIMGVLKAGAAYVPIDPKLPEKRISGMVDDAELGIIISSKNKIRLLNRLQWECACLDNYLCLDSYDVHAEEEESENELMDKDLWRYVGELATDHVQGGGWKSSYTGEFIPKEEMEEYGNNILVKLKPFLTDKTRILEIGCASGISMFNIAPHVGFYYGTDLSETIIERDKVVAARQGFSNIKLEAMAAHEIDRINEGKFDIVIINSVIQCFHGHNYLRQVIDKIIDQLDDNGIIFLGDIMDQDLKDDLIASLKEHKVNHPEDKTKIDFSAELFVAKDYFRDLAAQIPEVEEVDFSEKIYTIENELTRFRYDAMMLVDKKQTHSMHLAEKRKHQYCLTDLEEFGSRRVKTSVRSGNLAYVIFTSGSTGKPKGVLIEHRALANLCAWHNTRYEVTDQDRATKYAGLGFDASVWEIFPYLVKGAALYIVDNDIKFDARALNHYFNKNGITIGFLPTQMCEEFMKLDNTSLRILLTGGDKLRKFEKKGYQLVNNYGPTENTVVSTCFDVNTFYNNIPIGVPVSNCKIYILSKEGNIQPIGVPGELCIAGDSLARGYLRRPDLTAEKFTFVPALPGIRIYRTGDLARWLDDGNIEFLGRIDYQVKIRGFRIELGEIENQLLKHKEIREVVVIDRKEENTERYLCAYFIAEKELKNEDLKEYLSIELPDYMVPTYFVRLDVMPLNPSGKIDRKALPEPKVSGVAGAEYEAPKTDIEKALAAIFSEILDVKQVGLHDNFFDLGGHSLKVTVLVDKVKSELKADIPLLQVFKSPQVKDLAAFIEDIVSESGPGNDENLVLLNKGKKHRGNIFFIHAGSGEMGAYSRLAEKLNPEISSWGIKASHLGGFAPKEFIMEEVVANYVMKIRAVQSHGPYRILGWCVGGAIGFEIVRQLEEQGEEVSFFGMINTDFSKPELWNGEFSFSVQDEIDFAASFIHDEAVKARARRSDDIEELWSMTAEYIKDHAEGTDIVKKTIPHSLSHGIPNFKRLDGEDILYFMNACRTFDRMRAFYEPGKRKINTPIRFFVPEEDIASNIEKWKEVSGGISFHPVPGEHGRVFARENIDSFVDIFESVFLDNLES